MKRRKTREKKKGKMGNPDDNNENIFMLIWNSKKESVNEFERKRIISRTRESICYTSKKHCKVYSSDRQFISVFDKYNIASVHSYWKLDLIKKKFSLIRLMLFNIHTFDTSDINYYRIISIPEISEKTDWKIIEQYKICVKHNATDIKTIFFMSR